MAKKRGTARRPKQLMVFVSSTYRDLAPYREKIKLAFERSGIGFQGMELFTAQDSPPLKVCLDALRKSDVYVGVIGKLYGSSPPGKQKSYTELEYECATKLKMDRIMFILDDNAEIKPVYVEQDPKKIKRLSRFLKKVKQNHTVEAFTNPDEVTWRILASLQVHMERLREKGGVPL
jgi:hypothetical protein